MMKPRRKSSRQRLSRGLRAVVGDRRGQTTIEFMLMMVVLLLLALVFVNLSFFGSDLLLARYGAFQMARGYLCRDTAWSENGTYVYQMMITAPAGTGVAASDLGDGVRMKMTLREMLGLGLLFGDSGKTSVEREVRLGKEPALSGDNQCESSPQS
jgi:hypothetical protein